MKIIQVGSGGWAKGWLEYIHADPEWELTALVSRGGSSLEEAKARYGLADSQCFTDFSQALKLDCDVVLIALPHRLHLEYAAKAVRAGKNVLIEKPLCESMEDAVRFAEFMRGRPERAWVSQNFRFRKQLWQMKASLGAAGIGSPRWADVNFRLGMSGDRDDPAAAWQRVPWRREQASLLFLESAIHHFDMMRFLTGSNASSIYATAWTPEWGGVNTPLSTMAVLEFESGFKAGYSASIRSIGFETGWQGNWLLQTDAGAVRWEYDGELCLEMGDGAAGALVEDFTFAGQDRGGVLSELKRQLRGEPGAVPDVFDNLNSLAVSFAALKSLKEQRKVLLSEILEEKSFERS